MAPLAVAHPFVDDDEQRQRRAEEAEIVGKPAHQAGAVLARDPERFIQHLADAAAAGLMRLPEVFRIDRPVRRLAGGTGGQLRLGNLYDLVLLGAGYGDDAPGLRVAAGGRALGCREPVADFIQGERIGQEAPC